MATVAQWMAGARVRTLPNSVSPVLVGAGAAVAIDGFVWWQSVLALLVAVAFQVGVNYANDYSDGIRGTDTERVGPLRLVGSGLVPPGAVRTAAFACFGFACMAGLVLVLASGHWWLLIVGVVSVLGAWFYTGGKNPYGYLGFGELAVFLFFGPIPVLGTLYVQSGRISWLGGVASGARGCFSAAVLAANNLRGTEDLFGLRAIISGQMAVALALRGQRDAAVRMAEESVKSYGFERDAVEGALQDRSLALTYILVGRRADAIAVLTRLLAAPSVIAAPYLKFSPWYDGLRGEPACQRLIAASP